ncbi:MAG: hypothetical protein SPG61_01885, partial [Arcanobacterium sp.]|nr:hypothetical protein [Arcanobacterium sp.]
MRYQGVSSAFWRLEIATRPTGERFFVHEEEDVAVVLQKSVDAYFGDEMKTSLFAYGDPQKAAEILKNLRAEYKRPDLVMISEEIFSELDRESRDFYGPHWGFSWEFFFAEEPLE